MPGRQLAQQFESSASGCVIHVVERIESFPPQTVEFIRLLSGQPDLGRLGSHRHKSGSGAQQNDSRKLDPHPANQLVYHKTLFRHSTHPIDGGSDEAEDRQNPPVSE